MEFELTNEFLLNFAKEALENVNLEKIEKIAMKRTGRKVVFEFTYKEANGVEGFEIATGGKMELMLGE